MLKHLLLFRIVLNFHIAEINAGYVIPLDCTYCLSRQYFHKIFVLLNITA
jgi:hypothetical protein